MQAPVHCSGIWLLCCTIPCTTSIYCFWTKYKLLGTLFLNCKFQHNNSEQKAQRWPRFVGSHAEVDMHQTSEHGRLWKYHIPCSNETQYIICYWYKESSDWVWKDYNSTVWQVWNGCWQGTILALELALPFLCTLLWRDTCMKIMLHPHIYIYAFWVVYLPCPSCSLLRSKLSVYICQVHICHELTMHILHIIIALDEDRRIDF